AGDGRAGLRVNLKERSMKQVLKNERGMALAIAVVALVIVGALIAGALFSGTQEQRVAEHVRRVQASFGVAEEGVYDIIGGEIDQTASIDGNDLRPTGWAGCPPFDSAKAGIRTQWDGTVATSGHPTLVGNLPVLRDPALADSSFTHYGDVTYDQLAATANITLAAQNFSNSIGPAVSGTTWDVTVPTNWGSPTTPTGACGNYFPIVHITGTGSIINGREGQGVLLVDG